MPTKYVVNEHFRAFQGEGVHMGLDCYFVRLHGCDQSCHFCDSAGTWHPNFKAPHPRMTGDEIAEIALTSLKAYEGQFVVVTGGEPTLYDLTELRDALHARGLKMHLETAGHHPIPDGVDWITLSPKLFATPPLPENLERANEFKIIVEDYVGAWEGIKLCSNRNGVVWLHPEWSKRNDPEVLEMICGFVRRCEVRAGYQLHKLYQVDQRDPNSDKRRIPLGGDINRGY